MEGEARCCDVEARRVLGPRRSSVFPAPDPRVITAPTYGQALERARFFTGAGISKQAHGIYPKILEVNWALTPSIQGRVFELHPEVSFWALAGGQPMAHPKRTVKGYSAFQHGQKRAGWHHQRRPTMSSTRSSRPGPRAAWPKDEQDGYPPALLSMHVG